MGVHFTRFDIRVSLSLSFYRTGVGQTGEGQDTRVDTKSFSLLALAALVGKRHINTLLSMLSDREDLTSKIVPKLLNLSITMFKSLW